MSPAYLGVLAGITVAIFASRLVFRWLPLARAASHISIVETVTLSLGALALALHCGAMFFRSQFRSFPGGPLVIRTVNPLGTPSILWFALAAALVLVGLRRQGLVVFGLVTLSLAAVGITMYDGGSLHAHLTAIFVSVVLLSFVVATLVIPPWSNRPPTGELSTQMT